jgi:hypothetical protein
LLKYGMILSLSALVCIRTLALCVDTVLV